MVSRCGLRQKNRALLTIVQVLTINMQVISFHFHENNLELLTFNLESNVDAWKSYSLGLKRLVSVNIQSDTTSTCIFNTTFSFIIGFKWRHNHVTWKPKHLYFMYKDGVVYMQLVHASLIFRKLIYFIPDIPFYINLEHFWKLYGHKKMDARWSCVWKRALHFLF